jgi:SAM-dependent methyltransferase
MSTPHQERSDAPATPTHDVDQRLFFQGESLEYFRRNYDGRDVRELPLVPILEDFLATADLDIVGGKVLEIGCGAANNLHRLCDRYGAAMGVGTEPSSDTVEILGVIYPEYEFYESSSNNLPFGPKDFDLVVLRSVLHWIDRNYLLQTVGEAIRVTGKYLLVSDFAPSEQYSSVYRHSPAYRTYKMPYRPIIEGSGFMRAVHSMRHDAGHPWTEIETILYERIPLETAFPVRDESDFAT